MKRKYEVKEAISEELHVLLSAYYSLQRIIQRIIIFHISENNFVCWTKFTREFYSIIPEIPKNDIFCLDREPCISLFYDKNLSLSWGENIDRSNRKGRKESHKRDIHSSKISKDFYWGIDANFNREIQSFICDRTDANDFSRK